ncbi:metallophosphoesterase [Actinoalloteichus hymeniacidonis]|uniref:Calcineurin-like phosphoesterase domain-containing protein n=1 Tax=Actinoalloteichus hymeniacidonis TaxID=340345 RepID=A0AAC9MYB4_9PSEU|nr:metallophosphoesterase [Actinoalloteichus hymeniacidonis]AOS62792.1 hypothetical protein TL08_09885 [Actinoalloteichus hymeniacidonis]MBB5909177.1 hypothetical protein [Actinoalloteichus hymeniacidonis]
MPSTKAVALGAAFSTLIATGLAVAPVAAQAQPDQSDSQGTIAWISDTQYYSQRYPDIFTGMTEWVASEADSRGIEYLAHTGDIVEYYPFTREWDNASASMGVLEDAGIPYGVAAGNHDVATFWSGYTITDYGVFSEYFGEDRFADSPVYGESFKDNRQHYDLVTIGGVEFVVLYLAWRLDAADIAWASEVLTEHADKPAIIGVHEYIDAQGEYSGRGEQIFDELVEPHDNVSLVISGHIHGAATNVVELDGDRRVVEMLADYQDAPQGGSGYLRLLTVDTAASTLQVQTYSPHLDSTGYFDDAVENTTLPLDITP